MESDEDGSDLPPCRNAWAVPIAKFVCARPLEFTIAFWIIAALVTATAAKAELDNAKPRQVLSSDQRIEELEKRIEDIEINLAAQIAKPCACNVQITQMDGGGGGKEESANFQSCLTKQGRFNMTKAEVESRLYSMWQCAYSQGIRKHSDP